LPIFTLQRVEGRLFRPMAWTSLLRCWALSCSPADVPVLCSLLFRGTIKEWKNPVLELLNRRYRAP